MMWAATRMGSRERWGWAAWLPFPLTLMLNLSEAASTGPLRVPTVPAGREGSTWAAMARSTRGSSSTPSSTMRRPPARPSSAGWKMNFTLPPQPSSHCGFWASRRAAPRSIAVWASWPQACILPAARLL